MTTSTSDSPRRIRRLARHNPWHARVHRGLPRFGPHVHYNDRCQYPEVRNRETFGILELTLQQQVQLDSSCQSGKTFTDSDQSCRGVPELRLPRPPARWHRALPTRPRLASSSPTPGSCGPAGHLPAVADCTSIKATRPQQLLGHRLSARRWQPDVHSSALQLPVCAAHRWRSGCASTSNSGSVPDAGPGRLGQYLGPSTTITYNNAPPLGPIWPVTGAVTGDWVTLDAAPCE